MYKVLLLGILLGAWLVFSNEIFKAAHEKGVMVAFEAAVAGGIPIIKALHGV